MSTQTASIIYYVAYFYDCTDQWANDKYVLNRYRIEINIYNNPPAYNADKDLIKVIEMRSRRYIPIKLLTSFMRWKFYHCTAGEMRISKDFAVFDGVAARLNWIRSVIMVELDYHVGRRNCLKPWNFIYFKEYIMCPFSGYGAEFYDQDNPKNNMSNSRLNQWLKKAFYHPRQHDTIGTLQPE